MQRRNLLIGMGSIAAGGTAILGTGATSITANNRTASVNVVADDEGLLGLYDTSAGDIIDQKSGELEINLDEHGNAKGISVGSEVRLGEIRGITDIGDHGYADTGGNEAFKIVNQAAGMNLKFAFEYNLNNPSTLNQNGSVLAFYNWANTHYNPLVVAEGSGDHVQGGTYRIEGFLENNDPLQPGQEMYMSVGIDTDNPGSSTSEDLSGTLTIEAEPDTSGSNSGT
jgi:hypothetical protein